MDGNSSSIPNTFYVFTNDLLPITFHNLTVTRALFSGSVAAWETPTFVQDYLQGTIDYLPFVPSDRSTGFMSVYCAGVINDYAIEYDAEICRRQYFPLLPSRLSALFAFGNIETCRHVADKWQWPFDTVRTFELAANPLNRVAKVNMEIISLARRAYRWGMMTPPQRDQLWRSYWSGVGKISMELPAVVQGNNGPEVGREVLQSGESWEYLVEGLLALKE